MARARRLKGENVEMVRAVIPVQGDGGYDALLGDADGGEATLFARQDYVEKPGE